VTSLLGPDRSRRDGEQFRNDLREGVHHRRGVLRLEHQMASGGVERSDQRSDYLDPWPVCRRAAAFPASAPKHRHASFLSQLGDLVGKPGFSDPWFAGNEE